MAIGTGNGPPDLEAAIRLADRYPFHLRHGRRPSARCRQGHAGNLRRACASLAEHPKVLAIGEIGLDYHYDFSPRDVQREVFERQMEIAAEAGKPIVIHTREAGRTRWRCFASTGAAAGIMHCFTGDEAQARAGAGTGLPLELRRRADVSESRSGARRPRASRRDDRLLVETDCPYLAPVPHRGKAQRTGLHGGDRAAPGGGARRVRRRRLPR